MLQKNAPRRYVMERTPVVNLFGGPGVGKSTNADGLSFLFKKSGRNTERVFEEAKDMTWEERALTLHVQPYVFAKQARNQFRLLGKVDLMISDSPLLLSAVYAKYSKWKWPDSFEPYILEQFNSFNNINIYLKRGDRNRYNPMGRNQTETEAREIDEKVFDFLVDNSIPHTIIEVNRTDNLEDFTDLFKIYRFVEEKI